LIHWPGVYGAPAAQAPAIRAQTWKALEELHEQGLVKNIGVSNYTIAHMEALLKECKVRPAANQVEFHPFLYQKELLEYCKAQGVVLQAYSPLAKGGLVNEPKIVGLGKKYNKSAAQVLIRWCLQHDTVVLPKSADPKRMAENVDVDFEISAEDMNYLDSLNKNDHCTWDPSNVL